MSTEPPLDQLEGAIEHTALTHLLQGRQGYHIWLIVIQLPMKAGWWDVPLTLRDFAEATRMILNKGGSPFCSHGGFLAVMTLP